MEKINVSLEIIEPLVQQGNSDEKIAHILGTNRKTIQEFRHTYHLLSGATVAREKRNEQIEMMLLQGISGGEISRRLSISPVTIAKLKKEKGLTSAFDMKLSQEDIKEAMAMSIEGKTDTEIAKVFGVSSGNIWALRRKRNIKSPFTYEMFSKVNKKEFEELFYMGWGDEDIAKKLNWTKEGIRQFRYRQGYKREDSRLAKNNPLTPDNLEIILGIMMGDGSMECKCQNTRLSFAHCERQKEYTYYIAEKLANLNPHTRHSVSKTDSRTGKCYDSYWCELPANPSFNNIYQHFYVNKIKRIPIELFHDFTWQSLAYMYMDDGSKCHCGGQLATNCFTVEDLHKFQGFLKGKFNLDTTIGKSNVLYIKAESFRRMVPMIEPYMCECMKYKIK